MCEGMSAANAACRAGVGLFEGRVWVWLQQRAESGLESGEGI